MQLDLPVSPPQRRSSRLVDMLGREITYLRLSVTDRCNLRCFYCMREDVEFLPKAEVLSLEELARVSAIFVRLGVRKLRLTGGEPLARPGVAGLVARLGRLVAAGELDELTLTTNGTLLARHAQDLAAAGVRRVNVSLDTLDEAVFAEITGHAGLGDVLAGIEAARRAGLAVRINTVALGGVNDREFDRLIAWCGDQGCDMALIELMPLGGPGRVGQFLPLNSVRRRLEARWTLEPLYQGTGGPAVYARVAETGRRIGFITPMSHGFCMRCNRVRLTCTGSLVLCLAQERGVDLRRILRQDAADEAVEAAIAAAVAKKPLGHHFVSSPLPAAGQRMWQVGG